MDEAVRMVGWGARIEANKHNRTKASERRGNQLVATGQNKARAVFTATLVGVTHLVVRRRVPAKSAEYQGRIRPGPAHRPGRCRLPRGRRRKQTFHILQSGAKSGPCPFW
jgi:hypothetical protein